MAKNVIAEVKKLTITKEKKQTPTPDSPEEEEALKVNESKKSLEQTEPRSESPTPSLNQSDILGLVKTMVDSAIDKLKGDHQQEIKSYESKLESLEKAHKDALEKTNQAWEERTTKLKEELETTTEANSRLEDLFKLTGNPNSVEKGINFNTQIAHDAEKATGILRDVEDMISSSRISKNNLKGSISDSHDTTQLDAFIAKNRVVYLEELEKSMKKNGLLCGQKSGGLGIVKAATTISDVVGGFLDKLSPLMRETHRPGHIFWQFPTTQINFTKSEGDTIQIPRAAYQASSTDPTDWDLSGGGAFVAIQDDYDPVQTGVVSSILKERGMGKVGTNIKPIRTTSFVTSYSLIDLISIINRNVRFNYCQFEDLKIRSLWAPTSRVVYNNNGVVTTTATDIDTGSNGTITRNFLISLRAYMDILQIQPYPDNCYGLVLHPTALAQFQLSLDGQWEAPNHNSLMDLTNILNPTVIPPGDTGKVSGYQGKYYGFHIFVQNAFAIGAAGTEGVQNVTLGSGLGSTLTRTSYAFGDQTIGRGIGDPMELRQHEITNYQRKSDVIWLSTEAFTALDVDPSGYSDTSTVPQQLRVLELRTLDFAA